VNLAAISSTTPGSQNADPRGAAGSGGLRGAIKRLRFTDRRDRTMKQITAAANSYADNLDIRVFFEREGLNEPWVRWLTAQFSFRSPSPNGSRRKIRLREFAANLLKTIRHLSLL
jgi:hypothetical protein